MAKTYSNFTDEQLLGQIQKDESDAKKEAIDFLMEKYKPCVRKEANAMFLIGGEKEDLIQEGMIGLFKAINDYNPDRESSFYSFARLCIRRQMYTAIKTSNRRKNIPLNKYVPLGDGDGEEGMEIAADDGSLEDQVISREYARTFLKQLYPELSEMEKSVLRRYLNGENYSEIAQVLGKSPKSIDNTLQRIKKKVRLLAEKV